ncbi:hypothetical protein R70006_04401 [Paraburkholderia domus]|jgi:glutathione S-transferase|uniref:Glutathione S-transferase n=2 Tax=Paraburkholderia domus TaxID=2793075 RepID=A0A9N8MW45_9BURK|nr:hypothetical protein R70006_04401 [Paraburkholderia domus]CAE6913468.1 hypothetical protein R70211_04055 [Paraburkholderia domus]CAE6934113.1 hypothetical protein R75471_04959 [Paraburkholderia domus]
MAGWCRLMASRAINRIDAPFRPDVELMVSVLLRLKASGLLDKYPNLSAYVARGEARAAYRRAFDAQLAVFTGKPPTSL